MTLAVVTATIDLARASECVRSWSTTMVGGPRPLYIVDQDPQELAREAWELRFHDNVQFLQTGRLLGVVPAFARGVQKALEDGAEIIACFHDDLEIEQTGWDEAVEELFATHPYVGLAGFGGAEGLGSDDIYTAPYSPMQLVRHGFMSNMRHAEAHGRRETRRMRAACLDGFSQIGRREYWEGHYRDLKQLQDGAWRRPHPVITKANLFAQMQEWGIVHHAYDAALGAFAAQLDWDVVYLPIACHHYGGRTAVADPRYLDWAQAQLSVVDWKGQLVSGDAAYWTEAHRIVYERFRGVLPIRVQGEI